VLHRVTHRRWTLAVGVVCACTLALAGVAAAGLVSSLGVAKRTVNGNSTTIVVDRRGDTIYELGSESLGKLKCITSQCLKVWPPVEVRSANIRPPKAAGVPGPLSILRRDHQLRWDLARRQGRLTHSKLRAIRGSGG
jgi:predicted lipoprotein with Yx(FWY)xxD motif